MDVLSSQLGGLSLNKPALSSPSLIVYLLGKKGDVACYFHASSQFILKSRCLTVPETFEVGQLYGLRYSATSGASFSELDEPTKDRFIGRRGYRFTGDSYDRRVLPALMLGLRVRDFEQNCAVIQRLPTVRDSSLIITMPFKPGYLKEAKFRTETGDIFSVRVKIDRDPNDNKTMKLFCTPLTPFPTGVDRKSRLEFCEDEPRTPIVTAALEGFYKGERTIDNRLLLDRIYGKSGSHAYSAVSRELIRVFKGGQTVILNAEQSEAVHRYNSSACPAFAVESPPGSGKTMTAAAMAVSYSGDGLQLFLSTANVPVFNMAFALAELDHDHLKIGHLISADREASQKETERSPFSIFEGDDDESNPHLAEFRRLREQLQTARRCEKNRIKGEMRRAYADAMAAAPRYDVLLGTVDSMLWRLIKPKNPDRRCPIQDQLETRVRRIVIDEASQMTEAALNAIVLNFPDAQIVLIGDSKQLPPFKYVKGDVVSELAACSALEVLKRKRNVPVITLRTVYRAAPSLMKHYSDVFYGGELVSGKPESTRVQLSSIFRRANRSTMFVKIVDSKAESSGTSLINDEEISALEFIVTKLRLAGYDHESVMIISYYEAQRKLALTRLPEGYEVLTVDSAQGREKDIVIVLTTRDSAKEIPFFSCPLRCNVAVSRHKEALIVLGHKTLLEMEPWKQVLEKKYFKQVKYDPAQ